MLHKSAELIAFESVSDSGFGHQQPGTRRLGFELAAQLAHVHMQILGLSAVSRAPNLPEELLVSDDSASAASQRRQKLVFDRREVHFTLAHENLALAQVEPQWADAEDGACIVTVAAFGMAPRDSNACQELADRKWFG